MRLPANTGPNAICACFRVRLWIRGKGGATLSDSKDGGQGRNRTANASLFRAVVSHGHLTDSTYLSSGSCPFLPRFIASITQAQPRDAVFASPDYVSPANHGGA